MENRFKDTIFKYNAILGKCEQLKSDLINLNQCRTIPVEDDLVSFA